MYDFTGGHNLVWKNGQACGDTLMNGHWEELIGKGEELFDATDDPDNYHVYIKAIIQFSSDGRQCLERLLRLHVTKCVQGVIEAMGTSGCASALVDLRQQQLVKKAGWICPWDYEGRLMNSRSIVNEAFDQALRDHPDLRNAVNAQVSVLCQSFK